MQNRVRIRHSEILADDWSTLRKTTFEYRLDSGEWQEQTRETYDRGNGATILLYNLAKRTVVLTRQFRFPAYVNHHHGMLVETPAGLLDGAAPERRIREEVEEETGYRIGEVKPLWQVFMSPGSVTERVHFFTAAYEERDRIGAGGGLEHEGENIEVLEVDIDKAMEMVASGEVADGKTIMLLQHAAQAIFPPRSMMILIAGPYRGGTGDDPQRIAANVAAMESYVMPLYEAGHLPVLGEWLALPMVRLAGSCRIGDEAFDAMFHPHAERLLARCDAVLRVGGESAGADRMAATAERLGKRVFRSLAEIGTS